MSDNYYNYQERRRAPFNDPSSPELFSVAPLVSKDSSLASISNDPQSQQDSGYVTGAAASSSAGTSHRCDVDSPYSINSQPPLPAEDELADTMFVMSLEDIPQQLSHPVYPQLRQALMSSPVERFGFTPPPSALRPTASGGALRPNFPPALILGQPRTTSPYHNRGPVCTQNVTSLSYLNRGGSNLRSKSAPVDDIADIEEEPSEEDYDSEYSDADEDLQSMHRYSRQTTLQMSPPCSSAPTTRPPMPDVVQQLEMQSVPSTSARHRCQSVPALQIHEIQSIARQLREVGDDFQSQSSIRMSGRSISSRNRRFSLADMPSFSSLTSRAISPAISLLELLGNVLVGSGGSAGQQAYSSSPVAPLRQSSQRRSLGSRDIKSREKPSWYLPPEN